jgi:hypothetical protein
VLLVHAATPEKRAKAREILDACGASRVWEPAEARGAGRGRAAPDRVLSAHLLRRRTCAQHQETK